MYKRSGYLLFFIVMLESCFFSKKFGSESQKFIAEKIRFSITDHGKSFSGHAFVHIWKDSLLNFHFFGPLGYDIFKGTYNSSLNIYDYVHKKWYYQAEAYFLERYHILVDRQCLQSVMLGDTEGFYSELIKLNHHFKDITIKKSSENKIEISDVFTLDYLTVDLHKKGSIPKSVRLTFGNKFGNMILTLDIITVVGSNSE